MEISNSWNTKSKRDDSNKNFYWVAWEVRWKFGMFGIWRYSNIVQWLALLFDYILLYSVNCKVNKICKMWYSYQWFSIRIVINRNSLRISIDEIWNIWNLKLRYIVQWLALLFDYILLYSVNCKVNKICETWYSYQWFSIRIVINRNRNSLRISIDEIWNVWNLKLRYDSSSLLIISYYIRWIVKYSKINKICKTWYFYQWFSTRIVISGNSFDRWNLECLESEA